MKKYTTTDIAKIEMTIQNLIEHRKIISNAIFKERQKLYNHRKYLKRKSQEQ